jgi:hypothetical protein
LKTGLIEHQHGVGQLHVVCDLTHVSFALRMNLIVKLDHLVLA